MGLKVIHERFLPAKPVRVFLDGFLVFLVLERLKAPGWVYGVIYTILSVAFVANVICAFTEKRYAPDLAEKEYSWLDEF